MVSVTIEVELRDLGKCVEAFEGKDQATRTRMLTYLVSRYSSDPPARLVVTGPAHEGDK